jgi:hypothetical protein
MVGIEVVRGGKEVRVNGTGWVVLGKAPWAVSRWAEAKG